VLFNSALFIFGFLPAVLLIYWGLQRAGKTSAALTFLVPASLVFYAYWNPPFVLLLIGSILFNYICGLALVRLTNHRRAFLIAAIGANLSLLVYFKYALLLAATLNHVAGTTYDLGDIFLPLGISFFTFHQVTYLIDIYKKTIKPSGFRNYALYVSFFPQLIAGPIVRAWEIIPQFENFTGREKFWQNMALGSALFITGLFKKVVIADTLATFATPVFTRARNGDFLSFFDGWSGATAYTFQLYFDFSGYSDMALGLALMLGFILPINFLSPYKSTSITEFWRRWHMTLSRFFRDYVYIPLGGNRSAPPRQIVNVMFTMFLAGLWHGAGWTFAVWGLLHGFYLVVNRSFTTFREKFWPTLNTKKFTYRAAAHILTMLALIVSWVLFRAEDFGGAMRIFNVMSGADGIVLPRQIFENFLGNQGWLRISGPGQNWIAASWHAIPWVIGSYALCLLLPASVEYFGLAQNETKFKFKLNFRTASVLAIMGVMALFSLQRISEFLYFQF
jgi:alginate O-acetyltransferase complex protein AlgI